jgi:phosphotransferase system enzyme I (PtsP)
MVTSAAEFAGAKRLIHRELTIQRQRGHAAPSNLRVGAMIEVPSIVYELDALLPMVDFVSVGSNDLLQFLFAADRGNPRVAHRYDSLSVPALRAMKAVVDAGARYGVPVTLCGEMAGRAIEAMALIGVGFRSLSMAPASIGPVKAMILSLDAGRLRSRMEEWMASRTGSLRDQLRLFAESEAVEI